MQKHLFQRRPRKHLFAQSPIVIKRWMRKQGAIKGQAFGRWINRWWLPIRERKRRRALESAFEAIKAHAIECEKHGHHASLVISNMALYFLIAERDLQTLKIDALTHPDEWRRNLFTRVILLTIYELDMDQVAGLKLRNALIAIGASDDLCKQATDSLRLVRVVQQKAKKKFGDLRNTTIAHRDNDALIQYRAIRNLRWRDVFEVVVEFYAASHLFLTVLPQLIRKGNDFSSLLLQEISKTERGQNK